MSIKEASIPEYKYRVKDYSIVTPWFRRNVVHPLLVFVPWSIPANLITLGFNLFMFAALVLSMLPGENRYVFLVVPILVSGYIIGDHLDGMQAKRTGTSSALGEFFDHFLDVFNNGILVMIVSSLMNVSPWVFVICLAVGYIAHSAIFFEQLKTGWLIFEKFGALEALILILLIIASLYFARVHDFLLSTAFMQITWFELFMIFSAVIALITWLKTLLRVKVVNVRYISFVITLIILVAILISYGNSTVIFLTITLFSAVYIGNNQRSHLTGLHENWPDFIAPLMLSVSFYLKYNFETITNVVIIYLAFRVLWITISTIIILRKYWVWRNPLTEPLGLNNEPGADQEVPITSSKNQ
jgi:phosphatidylglycerophosphate synthase